jgi:hypothetical protein
VSEFGDVMDAILAVVQTAVVDTVQLSRGYVNPYEVTLTDTAPVWCMVFNPLEDSVALPNAQAARTTAYELLLVRKPQQLEQVSTDLDLIRDALQVDWPPAPGPLGGLVEQLICTSRDVSETASQGHTFGGMVITTGDAIS